MKVLQRHLNNSPPTIIKPQLFVKISVPQDTWCHADLIFSLVTAAQQRGLHLSRVFLDAPCLLQAYRVYARKDVLWKIIWSWFCDATTWDLSDLIIQSMHLSSHYLFSRKDWFVDELVTLKMLHNITVQAQRNSQHSEVLCVKLTIVSEESAHQSRQVQQQSSCFAKQTTSDLYSVITTKL